MFNLNNVILLDRNQQKKIQGGDRPRPCADECSEGSGKSCGENQSCIPFSCEDGEKEYMCMDNPSGSL